MKIVLLQMPSWGLKSPPYGMACLSAYLKDRNIEVIQKDLNVDMYNHFKGTEYESLWAFNEPFWGNYEKVSQFVNVNGKYFAQLIKDILVLKPDLVGFSILWSTEVMSRIFAQQLKIYAPNIRVVFGGPHCARQMEGPRIASLPEVDFVVHGEGEETLFELQEALKIGKDVSVIKGLFSKKDGKVFYKEDRPLITNLDSLPLADFTGIDFSLYPDAMIPVSSSRGCPNRCIYCDEKTFWHTYRTRSAKKIFAEVKQQYEKYGVKKFEFVDSLVNGNIKVLEEFCDLLIQSKLPIKWMGQAAVRKEMTKELLDKINKSGCFHLCFGMEHSSSTLMYRMGKLMCKGADFSKLIRNSHEVGLKIGLNWMFGFPGETEQDFQSDLDFFTENKKYLSGININNSPGFCGFTPGCYAYSHPEEFDIIIGSDHSNWKSKDGTNTYVTRLNRFQKFAKHLKELGLYCSFPVFSNEAELIGNYYYNEKDYINAAEYLEKSLKNEGISIKKLLKLFESLHLSNNNAKIIGLYREFLERTKFNSEERKVLDEKIQNFMPFSGLSAVDNYINPDVILIQAPGWGIWTPPLGIAMLSSYVRSKGYKVLPIDLNIEFYLARGEKYKNTWSLEQSLYFWNSPAKVDEMIVDNNDLINNFINVVLESKAKIIGFAIYASSLYLSLYLARKIKAADSSIKIIFGGPHVSRFQAGMGIVKENCVDLLVQGEGELTLIDIIERVKAGKDLKDCPGTLCLKADEIVDNGDRDLMSNLDDLPFVDFSDFKFSNYQDSFKMPLMSSRGCVNQCIFCNERPYWRKYRSLTAERIFSEVQWQLKKYPNINWIDFQDSVVNGNVRELSKFADLIIKNGIKMRWAGQAVIRKEMTLELLKRLKESGCVCLAYGLETPISSIMLKVGKVASKDCDPEKLVRECAEAGLTCSYNFMFGLPGESEEDFNCTLDFLRRNRKYIATVNPSPSFCGFSKGTLGYENPEKYGLDLSHGLSYWETKNGDNNYRIRLRRFEQFCRLVQELKISTTYPSDRLLDRERCLAQYFYAYGQYDQAILCYEDWLNKNPTDQASKNSLEDCYKRVKKS